MVQFRTVCLSAHLDSFCRKLDELCGLEFVYECADPGETRRRVGWSVDAAYRHGPITPENTERAKTCELLYDMLREVDIFEARAKRGLKTVYASERWLKPISLFALRLFGHLILVRLPGVVRLLVPHYRKMTKRLAQLMEDPNFFVFPIGVPAVRDMVRIYHVAKGDWRFFFHEPKVGIERKLGGSVRGFPRMRLWSYFVERSKSGKTERRCPKVDEGGQKLLKILWVGRMLDWKRVDTLIKAFKIVARHRPAALLLVGEGPERHWLEKLAGASLEVQHSTQTWIEGKIAFHNYVKSDEVRQLMRQASVYVMPSNAEEGWGAAVSDALSEGCPVLSTYEAGSSATLLPDKNLFTAGNVDELADLLSHFECKMVEYSPEAWGGIAAAEEIKELVG